MTLYDWFLGLPENVLCHINCDLDSHEIYFKNKVIYHDGSLIDVPFSSQYNLKFLRKLKLISLVEHEELQINWSSKIKELFLQYYSCLPKTQGQKFNFCCADPDVLDLVAASDEFYRCKLALELYVLFHYVNRDLILDNPDHFFVKITEHCVVFTRWITSSRRFLCRN